MEGHIHQNKMQLAFDSNGNFVSHLAEIHPYQQYIMEAGGDGNCYFLSPLPHWIECQQTTHNYVEYLAESGISEIQGEISCNNSGMAPSFKPAESFLDMSTPKVRSLRLQNEEAPVNNFICTEQEIDVQKQESNAGQQNAAQPHTEVRASTSCFPPKPRSNNRSRQRATAADRRRRSRIAVALDALQELLPHAKEGSKANLLEDIIDHIKFLQLHMKELSQNRLRGESTSNPFIFLEGCGHYLLHENMLNDPLEDMMGRLLEVNPLAAAQLLESIGLFMMPMALAEGLH